MFEEADLNPGSYDRSSYYGPEYNYVLTISEVAAVPEPASWTVMMAGFGAIGMAVRRRRQPTSVWLSSIHKARTNESTFRYA
jgi:hypothetical protein